MAMAALFGASIMAISALYIDMRAFDRLMRLHGGEHEDDDGNEEPEDADAASNDGTDSGISGADDEDRDGNCYFRPSSALPNPGLPRCWAEEEDNTIGGAVWSSHASPDSSLRADSVPPGLPPLRIAPNEGDLCLLFFLILMFCGVRVWIPVCDLERLRMLERF